MAGQAKSIDVNTAWCKACGICASVCPMGVFEAGNGTKARVVNPEVCTGCELCERICPDLAITLEDR